MKNKAKYIESDEDQQTVVKALKPNQQVPKRKNNESKEELLQMPQRIQNAYQAMKSLSSQNSTFNEFSASQNQNNKILLYLKELHMKEQSTIVKGIKQMSDQSKKMIEDLTSIQSEIDKYQNHVEEWVRKIQNLSVHVDKITYVQSAFKKRANSMSKLKDFLNVQRPKRR